MKLDNQIPRVIHYCWFGGNPLPELAVRCIESWKKYCPEYEIKEWNESNFNLDACAYVREAYQAKKWAFVSDYARFEILYRYGGLYFDTDVELIGSIDDILHKGAFLGVERDCGGNLQLPVNPGLGMAAAPGLSFYADILEMYNSLHFLNEDGTYNQTTVVKYTTELLSERGLMNTEAVQTVAGINIYPWDYFCPMRYGTGELTITENTRSIHHYSASWLSEHGQKELQFRIKMSNKFGPAVGTRLGRIYSFPRRVSDKLKRLGFVGTVKFAWKKLFRNKER